ncbi:MAG TPA: transcription antitermination factor NusB [Rhizomicrobium sp.]|jgi:16S rRNA (cytosine967-C5)-methyltransferase
MTDTGLPARRAALSILSGVLQKRRPLDAQLEQLTGLETRDAGFARALVSQTLRHMGALDAVLRKFIAKPLAPHKAGTTIEILLLGACELLILKVAAHAAVDAANELAAKDSKAVHFKPLINAVLRKVASQGEAVLSGLDRERLSTPDWLWTRWTAQYGAGTARLIARAHQQSAPIDIVLKSADTTHPESDALFGNVRRLTAEGRIEEMPGFADGDWWVQDAAATLPARLLGDVAGKTVIDLCAAPGGKTMQLAAAGAKVIAVEIDAARSIRIQENLTRTRLAAEIVPADARDFEGRAPFVLIDAPCTATGTIRRHPDLPWIKGAADVTVSAGAAYEILESGASLVEPGGTLVFAVCSLEREEGEEQIAAFLAAHPEFTRAPITAEDVFAHEDWITPDGDLRTLPFMLPGGMDGFYAARLKRSETP